MDHDLRYDQEAADERTHYNLRTVKMPDLRSPDARTFDAQARDLRTAGDKIAELQQQVSTLQAVCSELSCRLAALERGDVPFPTLRMAEDAWSVG